MHEADGLGAHPTKRAVIHCYNCGEGGHYANQCAKPRYG
ncbi:Protein CBG20394 [Caenorhabditis briggsae]|uniref:Protein CBG20394 n=1 Tax=Caenorhabditis briggsae TaxID=6238 RepID=A8XXP1_CAEBR|nr:Protein CBG20394 [Caenorhabditis briggsae]CAP37410.2 Protein CBG20394 [Caenorhabditis briggsae]